MLMWALAMVKEVMAIVVSWLDNTMVASKSHLILVGLIMHFLDGQQTAIDFLDLLGT